MDVNAATSARFPRWLTLLTGGLLAGLALVFAWLVVFSRSMSPDEGYVMITVQGFLDGHPLYDSVFTQYGPFFYFHEWVWHGLLAVPLTHDSTRMLCVAHWLAAAGFVGAATGRLTRSPLAGLAAFALAVAHLAPLANEPGHPQELVALLLGAWLFLAAGRGQGSWGLVALAGVVAAVAFTKINVGIFLGFALMLALVFQAWDRFEKGPWRWVLAVSVAALPFALMRQHLDAEWCRNYALVLACAVFATVLVAGNSAGQRGSWRVCLNVLLAMAAATAGLSLVAVAAGTSPRGLLDGLLLTPLRMPGTALLPLPVPNAALASAVGAVATAIWMRRAPVGATRRNAVAGLKAAFVFASVFILFGKAQLQLAWLLPWVWLVAVTGDETPSAEKFPRALLALGAAWQGLQAYPIAGTQVTVATMLLVPAAMLCLSDVARALAWTQKATAVLITEKTRRLLLAQGLAACALVFLFAERWVNIGKVRREHDELPALALPGSSLVRMDQESTEMYRELSAYLRTECDTFVSYPGIHSLYFWSGKRPPTQLNSTGWGQLSHAQQEEILGALRRSRRPLLVVVVAAVDSWSQGVPEPIRPLVRSVKEDWRERRRLGRFIIFEPKPAGAFTQKD